MTVIKLCVTLAIVKLPVINQPRRSVHVVPRLLMKVKPKQPRNKQVNRKQEEKDRDTTEVHTNTNTEKIITHKTQVGKGYLSMVLNQRQ
jgi:hypothetical protein